MDLATGAICFAMFQHILPHARYPFTPIPSYLHDHEHTHTRTHTTHHVNGGDDAALSCVRFISDMWSEKSDPKKAVYEDIAIASYLLCLWELERERLRLTK